ncbi:hypothetical protein POVWA2_032900 [Plasmodium ovale wallikeri]|uniref:Uncharacterized protein n=1 Tax=Plasmodium ovale wallikeri TaxID=864142 RepID=A0A1A8YXZ8_PLAOA|nr:hypothetical protein POVWA1_033280 [Plasmodium ovale wallikeri]SBT37039.1 hypothetical protein POVWA2_032900 [Plasmodium ovale wallikeri]
MCHCFNDKERCSCIKQGSQVRLPNSEDGKRVKETKQDHQSKNYVPESSTCEPVKLVQMYYLQGNNLKGEKWIDTKRNELPKKE